MDFPEAGTAVGSGLAAFLASWLALFRPLHQKQRLQGGGVSDKDMEKLRARLGSLVDAVERLEAQAQRIEDRLQRAVTDEEFATYSGSTTAAITSLTEKVGMVTGAVDAWYRGAAPPRPR